MQISARNQFVLQIFRTEIRLCMSANTKVVYISWIVLYCGTLSMQAVVKGLAFISRIFQSISAECFLKEEVALY